MADIPLSVAVPQIYVPSLSAPQIYVPHIEVPHIEVPGAVTVKPIEKHREHVKDLGDLFLGNPVTGTEELHDTLVDNGFGAIEWVPLLNRIVGAGLMIKERTVEPVLKGDVKEAGINILESLGSTLDIVANPVKSLIPWAGGGTSTDLLKSMGWAPGEYRKEYQWDTGNLLVDLVGEVMSDPINWVTWGGKQAIKKPVDTVIESYRRAITKEFGEDVAKNIPDEFIKRIVIDSSDDLVDDAGEIVHSLMKRVEENRLKLQDELLNIPKSNPMYERMKALIKEYDNALTIGKHFDLMDDIADLRLTDGLRKYNAARSVIKAANKFDNFLLAAGLGLNPLAGGTALLMTKVISPKFNVLWNSAIKRLKNVDMTKLMNNTARGLKLTGEYVAIKNKILNRALFEKFNPLLKKYNYDVKKLQNLYITIANSVPPSKLSTEYVNQLFLAKLTKTIPELKNLGDKNVQGFIRSITPQDLNDLVNAVSDGGITMYYVEQAAFRQFKAYLEQDMADFWGVSTRELKDYDAIARLRYIDEHLLPIQGKHFNISNLKEALTHINNLNPEMYVRISSLLDYVGVNLNNYTQVATLLKRIKDGDNSAIKKLKELLTKNRTGALLNLEEVLDSQHALVKYFHAINPKLNFGNDLDSDAVVKFFSKEANSKAADIYNKAYQDINNKVVDESVVIKKIQTNIDYILYKTLGVDLFGVDGYDAAAYSTLNVLDNIENYVGSDESISEIFSNVLNFNTDKIDLDSIKAFSDNLEKLRRTISMLHQRIIHNQIQGIPSNYVNVIADLDSFLKKAPVQKVINDFADLYASGEQLYRLMVSQQGMYALMELNIMADLPNEWLKELSNIDSPTRIKLQYISNALRRQRSSLSQDLSKALDDILTTIDSTNNLYVLMDKANYITSFDIPKEQIEFMKGMFFNVVYENRNKWISKVLEEPEKLTQRFIKEFERHNKKRLLEYFDDIISEQAVNSDEIILAERMRELRKAIDTGDATDAIFDEYDSLKILGIDETLEQPAYLNAEEMYNAFESELIRNVNTAFDEYAKALSELQKFTGNDLKFCLFFTNETVAHMNELGLNYNEIIEALVKDGAIQEDFLTVTDFITRVSGNVIQPELDTAKQVIKNFMAVSDDGFMLDELIDKQLKELADNTLAKAITKTFQEINMLNDYLSGNDTVIAKLRNKYGTLTKIKNYLGYVTVDEFNKFVRTISSYNNSYGWSTAHGFLAVKKDFDPLFIKQHNLTADLLRGVDAIEIEDLVIRNNTLNREYILFYNTFRDAYRYVDAYPAINTEYVKKARKALIATFKDNAVSWGPKDPVTYFLAASDKEILAWDSVASNRSMSRKVSTVYGETKRKLRLFDNKTVGDTIEDQIKQYKNPAGVYTDVRNMLDTETIIEEDAWDYYIDTILGTQDVIVFDGLREDLSSYIKDPASLQEYKRDFENYIRNDIDALNNTQIFADLSKDKRTVREVLGDTIDQEVLKLLKSYGITPNTFMGDATVLKFLKAERAESLADTIRSLNADQLRYYLDTNTAGIMFFVNNKPDFKFNFTPYQLKRAGLKIELLKGTDNIYVIRGVGTPTPTKSARFKYKKPKYVFETVQQQITNSFKANRNYFYWDGMDLPDELFTGDMLNKEVYDAILEDKNVRDIIGNLAEQKTYSKIDDLGNNSFYTKKISRPNLAIVGSASAYNDLLDAVAPTLKAKNIEIHYIPTRIDKAGWRGSIAAIKRVNTEHKYLQLFMNNDFSLGSPMFQRVLKNATDEEIKNLFKRNNFDACILRENSKGQPTIYKIHIENQKQLADAVKAKAIIVPHEVYRNMVLSINQHKVSAKLLKFYRQTIVSTFKTIYLTSPGYLVRNALDSLMYKNLSTTDGVVSIAENFKYEYRAARMLKEYDDIVKRAIKLSGKEQGTETFNRYYLKKVLNTLPQDKQVAFRLTDVFMNSSASAGLTKSLQDFLLNFNMKDAVLDETVYEMWYKKYILNNPYVSGIQNINDYIEKTARYGLFLNLIDNGTELTETIRKVVNTHFDYQIKEPGMDLLEQIFWFSTFPINNMFYYLNEGITRNPDMLKMQMDALELSWNDGTYTWEELKNSDYLMYNALVGNIRFEWDGKQIVVKTGSSVMDFFNLMFNPVNEAVERINPFISVLTGLEKADQLNPINTVTNRIKQIKNGQSYVPSVYSTLYERKPKRHYIEREPYVKRTWSYSKPKRSYFKKPDNMKRMKSLFTTDRYYFGRGKNLHRWLNATTSIEPHWYIDNYRHYKFNKNYKSLSKSMQLHK